MKKSSFVNILLSILLVVGAIVVAFLLYTDMNTAFSRVFIIGYVIVLFVYALFTILLVTIKARTLTRAQIGQRLLKFSMWFVFFSVIKYAVSSLDGTPEISFAYFALPFGLSFGLAFSDLINKRRASS
ncbi:hypothetical protein [Priestia taiwanensis]|uniref:Uncharacterized protein n=1 Tax=Priestia taiwanensis TaxID=1347902 RepID=A0A917AKF1_9BACI|nr:hypothetical protein [Priestia taiwanensis]MBM7361923.1 putative membrane protein [Priestia taiwanensis]GGE58041.1 hypothetical protein GCM10007140_05500 [Priestia taiwanensis]